MGNKKGRDHHAPFFWKICTGTTGLVLIIIWGWSFTGSGSYTRTRTRTRIRIRHLLLLLPGEIGFFFSLFQYHYVINIAPIPVRRCSDTESEEDLLEWVEIRKHDIAIPYNHTVYESIRAES